MVPAARRATLLRLLPARDDAVRPRRVRVAGGRPLTWALSAATALGAVLFALLVVPGLGASPPLRVPLWALAAAALVADLAVLRVPARRELHSLGLQGAVLAVGLLTAPVLDVALALAAARALSVALVRDGTPSQLVAGASRIALGALLGGTSASLVAAGAVAPQPRALVGAAVGVVVKAAVCSLLAVASAGTDGEQQSTGLVLRYVGASLLLALASGGLGAAAVVLLWLAGPATVLLLVAPAALLVLLAGGWARGRRAARDLDAVRSAARALTTAQVDEALPDPAATLLVRATRVLRAGRGELLLLGEKGEAPQSWLHVEGVDVGPEPGEADTTALAALDVLRTTALLLGRVEPGDVDGLAHLDPAVVRWLLVRGYPDLVAAPVCVDGTGVGVLAVSGRLRTGPRFGSSDLVLLSALAEQLGVQVGTARLTRRLGSAEATREQLEQRVFSDDLTGLARRPLFADRVEQALSQRGAAGSVAVLFVDLDGFKAVNDRLGHAAGDTVLTTISGRLSGLLRGGDTAARLGGDEFAVLVLGLDGEDRATLVAARVLDALSLPVPVEGEAVRVRASVGIAVAQAADTVERLLADADVAMYAAKRDGGGKWVLAERGAAAASDSGPGPRVEQLVAGLSGPTLPGGLEVHYQPTVDLSDGRVVGVEALVRWRHPELGLLAPGEFVPLAERLGRLVPLGRQVLQRALVQLAAWDAAGAPGLSVSVNLSGSELRDPGLLDAVAGALAEAGVSGDRLVLEVGEDVVGDDVEALVPVMDRLGALGVRWALDGFGVGAVPLGRLDRLPLSVVKMPAGLLGEPGAAEASGLSAGLVGLARSLGLEVVVEGVERASQDERVRGLHCDRAQGYHYGRPAPATAGAPSARR